MAYAIFYRGDMNKFKSISFIATAFQFNRELSKICCCIFAQNWIYFFGLNSEHKSAGILHLSKLPRSEQDNLVINFRSISLETSVFSAFDSHLKPFIQLYSEKQKTSCGTFARTFSSELIAEPVFSISQKCCMQAPIRAHIYPFLATFCYSSSLFTSDVNWICVILDEMSSSKSDIEEIQDATFSSIVKK